MRRLFDKAIVVIAIMLMSNMAPAQEKHVVVVTIDGFRPNFYLEDKWDTPNLKEMKREGAHAHGVDGVFPSVTYPSHTTIGLA